MKNNSYMSPEQLLGLDQKHLLTIEDNLELLGQKFQCHHEVLVPLAKLIRLSENDGIPLRVISSYRSFDYQMAIWNKKYYENVQLNLRDGSTVYSQELDAQQRIGAILNYSALPGTSRHHWGTDFDIFDASILDQNYEAQLTEQEFSDQGPCSALNTWIDAVIDQYDFFKPYAKDQGGIACEPWHISYQPIAKPALEQFPTELLAKTLQQSEVAGKSFVLPMLDEIVEKYVINICSEDH